jgi:hypothetical protein
MPLTKDIQNKINEHFKEKSQFTSDELREFLIQEYPNAAPKTISWKIYDLKSKGILTHIGRDIYALNHKPIFKPEISAYLKRIYNKITKELPLIKLCVWDSRWLNELMLHQTFKFYLVVEAEKDATESVFNCLTDFSKKVYLNPDKEIFERYISGFDEVIIIKGLVSEAPFDKITLDKGKNENIQIASLEKLLVDCLIDKDVFSAQQNEINFIYQNAFEKYSINMSKLKRYARRRDRIKEIENYLPQSLIENKNK